LILALSGSEWWLVLDNFIPISIGVACALHFSRVSQLTADMPSWIVCLALLAVLVLSRGFYTAFSPFFTAPIALLIAFMLMASLSPLSAVNMALSAKPLVVVGRASYSIYLWQQLVTAQWPRGGSDLLSGHNCGADPACPFLLRAFRKPPDRLGRTIVQGPRQAPAPGSVAPIALIC
jgi:peptidoglycan/LPS O-acetylase OafA/YrhL